MPQSGHLEHFRNISCVGVRRRLLLFWVGSNNRAVLNLNHALTPGSAIIDNTVMAAEDNSPFVPPILAGKELTASSVFEPANLLREARRQKSIAEAEVPEICVFKGRVWLMRLSPP